MCVCAFESLHKTAVVKLTPGGARLLLRVAIGDCGIGASSFFFFVVVVVVSEMAKRHFMIPT